MPCKLAGCHGNRSAGAMADVDVSSVDLSLNSDETVSGLSAKQISSKIDHLVQTNRNLKIEIDLYEDHLKKLGNADQEPRPNLHYNFQLGEIQPTRGSLASGSLSKNHVRQPGFVSSVQPSLLPVVGPSSKSSRRMSKSRSSYSDRLPKLSLDQKLLILQKERDDIIRERKTFEVKSNGLMDGLEAVLKETSMNLHDLEKEQNLFESEILSTLNQDKIGACDQKNSFKKLMKFFVENLKTKSNLSANLRIEGSSLKAHLQKLKMEIKQKEELGDSVSAVDFEQMEVENLKYLRLIEVRNEEISRLKFLSNASNQNLNIAKKKLMEVMDELVQVKCDLNSRDHLMEKINKELLQVAMDKDELERENTRLRRLTDEFEVPSVLRYMEEKSEMMHLRNELRIWKRKVEIAETMLNSQRHKIKKVKKKQLISLIPFIKEQTHQQLRQKKVAGVHKQNTHFDIIPSNHHHHLHQVLEERKQQLPQGMHREELNGDSMQEGPPLQKSGDNDDDDGDVDGSNTCDVEAIKDDDEGNLFDGYHSENITSGYDVELENEMQKGGDECSHDNNNENDMSENRILIDDYDDAGKGAAIDLNDEDADETKVSSLEFDEVSM